MYGTLVLLTWIGSSALAADLHVGPGQAHATLQSAVDAAVAGDRVVVHPGRYTEQVTVTSALTLTGSVGARGSRLVGPGPLLTLAGDVSVERLGFEPTSGRAVHVTAGDVQLSEVDVVGLGVWVDGVASLTVTHARFQGGDAGPEDGAHLLVDNATLVVSDALFVDGRAEDGGSIYNSTALVTVTDSSFFLQEKLEWMERFNIDPALASGPFVTTVTDVVGFFAFLGLASVMLL